MAASDISPQSGYIQHHLVHLNNTGAKQDVLADFSIINYDSVFWSLLTGFLTLFFLYRAARRATPGVPGRFQAAVEVLVEWVDDQAKQIVPSASTRRFAAPLPLPCSCGWVPWTWRTCCPWTLCPGDLPIS